MEYFSPEEEKEDEAEVAEDQSRINGNLFLVFIPKKGKKLDNLLTDAGVTVMKDAEDAILDSDGYENFCWKITKGFTSPSCSRPLSLNPWYFANDWPSIYESPIATVSIATLVKDIDRIDGREDGS